ncbi:3-isopropylmalate dehydratase small subunit [Phenylobacterium sp. Root700]|uniref:3-isopropylmalate dehydratase small subunit n=1 Tax=Phenylobacterium sp. Root700 TaxID=1736591 RepID=UPI0006F1EF02|nr:3-isopropylmalate dehydratase small subunit [Phenylobacterium sp. Root700]KRB40143.1 3-isopropylmalate dehydratase [Phenylobacterium sp. Root700]
MQSFTNLTAVAMPLVRANIDTDAIIPSREMKGVSKTGLKDGLFAGWRYTQIGGREPTPGFPLNDPSYDGCAILLGGENFGCGSSREHAAWALAEYGFRAIIAPSFNPIFFGNCVRNGIVPVIADLAFIEAAAKAVSQAPQTHRMTVDLEAMTVTSPDNAKAGFALEPEAREMLLHGLDGIDLTLRLRDKIDASVDADRLARPWIYL